MKVFNIIIFLLITQCSFSQVQELDFQWSAAVDLDRGVGDPVVIGIDNEYIILYKSGSDYYGYLNGSGIEVINRKTLTLHHKIEFTSPEYKKIGYSHVNKVFYLDKKITIFSDLSNDDTLRLMGSMINVDGTPQEIGKTIFEANRMKKVNKGNYQIMYNGKRDKYLINVNMPTAKKENEEIRYLSVNNKLEILADKNITLPYIDNLFDVDNTLIDSKGTIYMSGTKYETKADKRNNNGVSVFFVYSFETGEFNEIKFPVIHNLMWKIRISINKNDNILIEGRYQDESGDKKEDGIFSITMDGSTGKLINNYAWPITEAVLPAGLDDYKVNSAEKNNYQLKHIFNVSDDKKIALMESVHYRQECSSYSCVDIVTSENVLILTLDISGKVEAIKVLPKNQQIRERSGSSVLDDFTSYTPLYKDKSLYFLYNDHSKNIEKNFPDKFTRTRFQNQTASYLAKMSPEGVISRDILFRKKDEDGFLITPGNSFQISESEVLVFSYKLNFTDKTYKMGIITLNK